jgi:putative two-component system response regulator
MGYFMFAMSTNMTEALLANKIIYLGGAFLSLFITLSIIALFNIRTPRFLSMLMMSASTIMYGFILTIGFNKLFYKSVKFKMIDGHPMLIKEYGIMHTVFYVMVAVYTLIGIGLLFYCIFRKKSVAYRTIILFITAEMVSVISFFYGKRLVGDQFKAIAVSYIIFQVIFLLIMERTGMYNISITEASALIDKAENGFMSLDRKRRFLGANPTALNFFPEIGEQEIDKPFSIRKRPLSHMNSWLDEFDKSRFSRKKTIKEELSEDEKIEFGQMIDESEEDNNQIRHVNRGGKHYKFIIDYLRDGKRIKGYQIVIVDETAIRNYTNLLKEYNQELSEEVEAKTAHIQEIQDKMVLGLAEMVEGRDMSTGGHIKRTSEGIRILMDEMLRDPECHVDKKFARYMIKAAPMHDLGKIAVDDKILRKPGRFEPEEFEQMKIHAARGAEIVHKVLEGVEEPEFAAIAENVAHYHHERIDGSGYPDHLKGDEIPFEARIMAIADVYDALVSKRCYKDSMSFDQAFDIIEEGMGTQFDEDLNKYFLAARPKLESYYSSLENES